MQTFLRWLVNLLPADQWKAAVLGALLGVVFSAAFALSYDALRRLRRLVPLRRMLGSLADPERSIGLYVRGMFVQGNTYQSREPQYLPLGPMHVILRQWGNIPEVVGTADVRAANDVANILGAVGKREAFVYRSLEHDWDEWTQDLISIGGHYKTERLLDIGEPRVVSLPKADTFRTLPDKRDFTATTCDYGLIYRGRHPQTGAAFLALMGIGALGTEAAGYFLRTQAATLAALFPGSGYAVIVQTALNDGRQGAKPVWWWPHPTSARRVVHTVAWHCWKRRAGL